MLTGEEVLRAVVEQQEAALSQEMRLLFEQLRLPQAILETQKQHLACMMRLITLLPDPAEPTVPFDALRKALQQSFDSLETQRDLLIRQTRGLKDDLKLACGARRKHMAERALLLPAFVQAQALATAAEARSGSRLEDHPLVQSAQQDRQRLEARLQATASQLRQSLAGLDQSPAAKPHPLLRERSGRRIYADLPRFLQSLKPALRHRERGLPETVFCAPTQESLAPSAALARDYDHLSDRLEEAEQACKDAIRKALAEIEGSDILGPLREHKMSVAACERKIVRLSEDIAVILKELSYWSKGENTPALFLPLHDLPPAHAMALETLWHEAAEQEDQAARNCLSEAADLRETLLALRQEQRALAPQHDQASAHRRALDTIAAKLLRQGLATPLVTFAQDLRLEEDLAALMAGTLAQPALWARLVQAAHRKRHEEAIAPVADLCHGPEAAPARPEL